jgi:hypothetical protein
MKHIILIISLGLFSASLPAQQNKESFDRSITKFGGSFTVGDTFTADNLGYGLMTMTYRFFDPFTPGGFYYGFGGTDISHTVGGVTVADCRPVTIGWRNEVVGAMGFDMSFSPVMGARSIDNTIYGKYYLGVKPTAGIYFAISEKFDIELAYEPVIHLLTLSGSEVNNKTYHDFSFYVVLKKFSLIKELGWHSIAP